MDIPENVLLILSRLEKSGHAAYAVGGCVRDALRGAAPADWDIGTSALPEETMQLFSRAVETGRKYGTVTVFQGGESFEVTTFRRDGAYLSRRRPDSVAFVPSLDLQRRDFTINAMAAGADGAVIDPYGGQADLEKRVIRCVGDPDARFQEDALRILRALRFASQLVFQIEPETAAAMQRNCGILREISGERILRELTGLLTGAGAEETLRQFGPVLLPVLPEIAPAIGFLQRNPNHRRDVWGHTVEAVGHAGADPQVRWALLLHDLGKPDCFTLDENGIGHFYGHPIRSEEIARDILARLHMDKNTAENICALVRHHDDAIQPTRANVRRAIGRYGPELLGRLLEVETADCLAHAASAKTQIRYRAVEEFKALTRQILAEETCFTRKDMAIDGRAVLEMGVPPGPQVGRILEELLNDVLEGRCANEPDALRRRLKDQIKEGKDSAD